MSRVAGHDLVVLGGAVAIAGGFLAQLTGWFLQRSGEKARERTDAYAALHAAEIRVLAYRDLAIQSALHAAAADSLADHSESDIEAEAAHKRFEHWVERFNAHVSQRGEIESDVFAVLGRVRALWRGDREIIDAVGRVEALLGPRMYAKPDQPITTLEESRAWVARESAVDGDAPLQQEFRYLRELLLVQL